MKILIKSSCLLLSLSLALIPTIASAQFSNNEGGDVFKNAATGNTGGLLKLLNEVQLNGKINPNASNEQREQIRSATEDFRVLQMQALQESNKKTTVAPVVAPGK
jgi:hypothetical protein